MFFGSSGWLLNIGMHLHSPPGLFWISRAVFSSFLRGKKRFGAGGYLLVWCILKQLFTSSSVKSGRYLPRRFAVTSLEQVPRSGSGILNSYFSETNDFRSAFFFRSFTHTNFVLERSREPILHPLQDFETP